MFFVTNFVKAILVFRVPDDVQQEKSIQGETGLQEDTTKAAGALKGKKKTSDEEKKDSDN